MAKKKLIEITSCKQCPHLKQITSPYTGDSFDMMDVDSICTNPKLKRNKYHGSHKGQFEAVDGRALTVSDRPWQADKILKTIPSWCPL